MFIFGSVIRDHSSFIPREASLPAEVLKPRKTPCDIRDVENWRDGLDVHNDVLLVSGGVALEWQGHIFNRIECEKIAHSVKRVASMRWSTKVLLFLILYIFAGVTQGALHTTQDGNETTKQKAESTLRKAVQFFRLNVAKEGGYVYQVTSDLELREGEGDAGASTVWVQPPGTPAVGLAMLEAYQRTGMQECLDGAKEAGRCLLRGQLHSGGWQNHIVFDPELRTKVAYRVDGVPKKKAKNISSLDDDQTQASLRFLMQLDLELKFQDEELHEAILYGLDRVVLNQYPNGAWSQAFENNDQSKSSASLQANFPKSWSREFPKQDYWYFYTLNDQCHVRMTQTMWLASEIYDDPKYRKSALAGIDFLLLAQMPEPQPIWAQQYNMEMQPVWARRFEPPAVSGGESQVVIEALLDFALKTGDPKYLVPVPRALEYLRSVELKDGKLARFYELETSKPLYFDREYVLTYDDSDMPTHYSFKVSSKLLNLEKKFAQLKGLDPAGLKKVREKELAKSQGRNEKSTSKDDKKVLAIIESIDSRGAWVEKGKLNSIKIPPKEREMIRSETFIENVESLSRFLHAD